MRSEVQLSIDAGMTDRRILVTAALPYANGPIHLGHLVEYLQTDIWVRYQKLRGRRCIYLCADDTHGTAVMISARKAGVSEAEFIAGMQQAHERDFAAAGFGSGGRGAVVREAGARGAADFRTRGVGAGGVHGVAGHQDQAVAGVDRAAGDGAGTGGHARKQRGRRGRPE